MSDMTKKLNDGEHPLNLELIDYAIQIQLSKIEGYEQYSISELSENAMSNLIALLELRQQVKVDRTTLPKRQ